MSRSLKLATVCVIFLLAASLSVFANSNDSFQNANLIGVPHGGDVSGTFDFNSSTHQFSDISVSFVSSVFGNVNASDPGSINGFYNYATGNWSFQWQTIKSGDLITYDVVYNPKTNQFTASGSIQNLWNQGNFNYMAVPEGGNSLAYLSLCGVALLGAIFLSRKQRRPVPATQSI
ncbi:MAG: hypothetical protein ABSA29_01790 [Terriglobales bacterium]|jgi:hypothetical protein